MPPATAVLPLQEFLNWCDRLGIANLAAHFGIRGEHVPADENHSRSAARRRSPG